MIIESIMGLKNMQFADKTKLVCPRKARFFSYFVIICFLSHSVVIQFRNLNNSILLPVDVYSNCSFSRKQWPWSDIASINYN